MELIKKGLAYVCELTPEQLQGHTGATIDHPGQLSPYRDRPMEENLDLFRTDEEPVSSRRANMTLRAKIDLASGNFNMRDPVIYRIRHAHHHRHGQTSGASIPCTTLPTPFRMPWRASPTPCAPWSSRTTDRCMTGWSSNVSVPYYKPRQIEFARLGIDHTVMSKRKLRQLVEEKLVSGWDDPRMPTLCGLRRRGYTARSIRNFCERIGVAKSPNTVEYGFLEHCLREDLNAHGPAHHGGAAPGEAHRHQLSGGQERDLHGGE